MRSDGFDKSRGGGSRLKKMKMRKRNTMKRKKAGEGVGGRWQQL